MKVSVTYIAKDGRSQVLTVENESPTAIASALQALGVDPKSIAVNGEAFSGHVGAGDVITEKKSAKGG